MSEVQSLVPQAKAGRSHVSSLSVIKQQMALSQSVIPAVIGEYYSYASVITYERPLYALMKCKSNKSRMIREASDLGSELNAFFQFDEDLPRILSVNEASALGLLEDADLSGHSNDIWFAPTDLSVEQFMNLRDSRIPAELARACQNFLIDRETATELFEGLVVAFMTDNGKYGMFAVEEITSFSIMIEACHVLL